MDEAVNDLSFLATGLYGDVMPKQNGAPIKTSCSMEIWI